MPFIAALILLVSGCGPAATSPRVQAHDLNLVFVILDAARASAFGCYGNALATTPHIDRLAAKATRFERAYAQSAWTLPSTSSFMTGKYPKLATGAARLLESDTLATELRKAGLRTAAFSENPYVTRGFGFDAGFERFEEYFPYERVVDAPQTYGRIDSTRTLSDAVEWVEQQRDERFFLYLHLLPPHAPYRPPPPFDGMFDKNYEGKIQGTPETLLGINDGKVEITPRDLEHLRLQYLENLAYADHQVGRLLEALEAQDLLDRTIVVVASDHGEAFREHGVLLHNTTLYGEMIHVPLLIRFPPRFGDLPARYGDVVELRDLLPTICHALQIPHCPDGGRSLLRRLRAPAKAGAVARAWTRGSSRQRLAALVTREHKLLLDLDAPESLALYDLESDPAETRNLAPRHPAIVRRLSAALLDIGAERLEAEQRPLDEVTRERLRALGYTE